MGIYFFRSDEGKRFIRDKTFNMEYKKDIFPQSNYVRVEKGRLVLDREKPVQCTVPTKKYVCEEDLSLPNIQGC